MFPRSSFSLLMELWSCGAVQSSPRGFQKSQEELYLRRRHNSRILPNGTVQRKSTSNFQILTAAVDGFDDLRGITKTVYWTFSFFFFCCEHFIIIFFWRETFSRFQIKFVGKNWMGCMLRVECGSKFTRKLCYDAVMFLWKSELITFMNH